MTKKIQGNGEERAGCDQGQVWQKFFSQITVSVLLWGNLSEDGKQNNYLEINCNFTVM